MRSVLWLAGQLMIIVAGGAVMTAVVIAVWYGLSFLVLVTVGRLFPLRGWKPRDKSD